MRIPHTLYEIGRNSRPISLYRTERGKRIARWRRNGRIVESQALLTEVVNPAKVHRKIGHDRDEITIYAKLDSVRTLHPCEVVGELVALFSALDERKWFAAEKREAGNVHRHVAASRGPREVVEQPPPGVLETQLVDLVRPDGPRVLPGDVPVVIVLH